MGFTVWRRPEARNVKRAEPLYTKLPTGIPGFEPNTVVEVVGNLYGKNDAPYEWWQEFHSYVTALGFEASRFDPCLYFLRSQSRLIGTLAGHVDDSVTGGTGPVYRPYNNFVSVQEMVDGSGRFLWDTVPSVSRYKDHLQ